MQTFSSMLLGGILALGSIVATAQTPSAPADSLARASKAQQAEVFASKLLYRGPVVVHRPILADSTSLGGTPFDLASLSRGAYPDPYTSPYETTTPDKSGFFTTRRVGTDPATQVQAHYYVLYLLPDTYVKGKVSIETNASWELFLDGSSIDRGAALASDTLSTKPASTDVTLTPNLHVVAIKINASDTTGIMQGIKLRVGYTPASDKGNVRLLTEPRSYPDLSYMIYGTSLSGTATSPSGTYTILYEREYNGEKHITRAYLYRAGKRITELTGPLASAQWLPRQDKLYYDAKGVYGRTLYHYDPSTQTTAPVAYNLPEGSYQITPSEQSLLFYVREEGPKYKSTLDLFGSPNERLAGYRDRYFLSIYHIASAQMQPLTFGARSTYVQDIAADDSKLIFSVSTPTPTQVPFSRTDYYELDLSTFAIDTLFADTRGISQVMYTSRPGSLLVSGSADAFDYVGSVLPKGSQVNTYDNQLFLYDRKERQARPLTKQLDRTIGRIQVSRSRFEAFFTAEIGDRVALHRVDLASGAITRLSTQEDYVKGFSIARYGETLGYIGQSAMNADRYYTIDTRRQRETLVYDFSKTKMEYLILGSFHDWNWTAPDGTVLEGRYYLPQDFDPKKKYPMIVYYYGGTAPVSRNFEGAYSLAMYASLGYVVYSLNPSGSTGYGQEFAARHINAWGKRTADEIIGAVKAFTKAHSFVNASKIGCMGASYGGFMTQYLQTQTDLFAAAASHAGISAISSYWGEGYWGVGYSTVASRDSYPWNNPKLYTEQSPLFLADKINTPLLLIHGLSDTNVPAGESWQMFNALRILGKPVEFVGVYGEDHHILDPQKRYEWSSAIMAFFAKYLQDDPTWWQDLFPRKY